MIRILPSHEYLLSCFWHVENGSGLIWRRNPGHGRKVGDVAGTRGKDGWQVRLDGVAYKNHRIVWKMLTGKEPPEQIDHIDGNPWDNCEKNFREVNHSQNQMNSRMPARNTSGVRGVTVVRRYTTTQYHARISAYGDTIFLGKFNTMEEASAARAAAEESIFGEYRRTA